MLETTGELTAAMAAGREEAVEVFYRRYFDWLYAQARRASGRDEAFCLDVVQDSVLRVIRTVRKVESENQFRGWLALVVKTTAYDQLRAESRRRQREILVAATRSELSREASPDADDRLQWLTRSIAHLDGELAEMLEMRFQKRWTLRQIGQSLGMTIGAVDGRLRRALRELKLEADEKFNDDAE